MTDPQAALLAAARCADKPAVVLRAAEKYLAWLRDQNMEAPVFGFGSGVMADTALAVEDGEAARGRRVPGH